MSNLTERRTAAFTSAGAEITKLREQNARLIEALQQCIGAIEQEFRAMGDDWRDQPIMHRKNKILNKARDLLAKIAQEAQS